MRCIYRHPPGTCDCMLTEEEVTSAKEILQKNNEAAQAARAALEVAPRRIEQRLFERAQKKSDEKARARSDLHPYAHEEVRSDISILFILFLTVGFLAIVNIMLRMG